MRTGREGKRGSLRIILGSIAKGLIFAMGMQIRPAALAQVRFVVLIYAGDADPISGPAAPDDVTTSGFHMSYLSGNSIPLLERRIPARIGSILSEVSCGDALSQSRRG